MNSKLNWNILQAKCKKSLDELEFNIPISSTIKRLSNFHNKYRTIMYYTDNSVISNLNT